MKTKSKGLITPRDAEQIILKNLRTWPSVATALESAHGLVLRETIRADRDFPPYDRATMDGIAIAFDAWVRGLREFPIAGMIAAGQPAARLRASSNGCFQIMTGAEVPRGCNCIIPIERVTLHNGIATVAADAAPVRGQFIHRRGSDHKRGAILLRSGTRLRSPEIAIACAVGRTKLQAAEFLQAAIISTGDELIAPGRRIAPHQIRPSNAAAIRAALLNFGFTGVRTTLVKDTEAKIRAALSEAISSSGIVIITGGVSAGELDFVPGVLKSLGVQKLFHGVAQRPGKPLLFGIAKNKTPVFALPGNPVSALVCLHRYVLPALNRDAGFQPARVRLGESIRAHETLTRFVPVNVSQTAMPVSLKNSGELTALAGTDGFIELPPRKGNYSRGSSVAFFPWR